MQIAPTTFTDILYFGRFFFLGCLNCFLLPFVSFSIFKALRCVKEKQPLGKYIVLDEGPLAILLFSLAVSAHAFSGDVEGCTCILFIITKLRKGPVLANMFFSI